MSLFSFFKNKHKDTSTGIFIPNGDKFVEFVELSHVPINDIARHLGYNADMIHSYIPIEKPLGSKIDTVIFEVFTSNIIFVLTAKEVVNLRKSEVNKFIADFNIGDQFLGFTAEEILKTGIENQSLSSAFLSRVLKLNDIVQDGVLSSEMLGLHLYFSNGLLSDYQSSDGLSTWAKELKQINPDIIKGYQEEAEHYWGKANLKAVNNEVNAQADAFADIPSATQNPFCSLHLTAFGNFNFVNLLVAHYEKPISLDEFLKLNKGRFEITSENQYKVGRFLFEFDIEGSCVEVEQID